MSAKLRDRALTGWRAGSGCLKTTHDIYTGKLRCGMRCEYLGVALDLKHDKLQQLSTGVDISVVLL